MFEKLKKQVLEANLKLAKLNLSILTWGNVSQKSEDGKYFAIKPSGVSYYDMKVSDIVIIDMQGNIVEKKSLNPSSDTPTHLELYKKFINLKGIVHTHSLYGVAFAQAGQDIPCYGTTHADNFYGNIPCARSLTEKEINGEYEKETGKVIIEELKIRNLKPKEMPGILVKEHGPFCFSTKSGDHAVEISLILEEVAKMAILTKKINPKASLINNFLKDKHYQRKHGKEAYYGQKNK